ncbi:hypothetical protein LIN78_00540 [Leeia sp. TBRC 13508]|uniref:Uncharacterized protein n=1 Tax=Leeia speluncae TaxID=2884804 RepID=A0ABS8D314_9NEIS|nr:hypothetical protein [Leeia speluncae]MCB6182043.1 hypothetical protein [Leeia speluncae]
MTIAYYGSFPCKVREAVSNEDLLRMENAKSRGLHTLNLMRNNPTEETRNKPESEWSFLMAVGEPGNYTVVEMKISDCLAEAAPLEELAKHCTNCKWNVRSTDFGCGGSIHYPISQKAEEWLVSKLPSDLNTKRGLKLLKALSDFHYDGVEVDESRKRGALFESASSVKRHWPRFKVWKRTITSSQIFHMLFTLGDLPPSHTKLSAYFLGVLDENEENIDDLSNTPHEDDDQTIFELKQFFSIAALASKNSTSVFIDA